MPGETYSRTEHAVEQNMQMSQEEQEVRKKKNVPGVFQTQLSACRQLVSPSSVENVTGPLITTLVMLCYSVSYFLLYFLTETETGHYLYNNRSY